jgi:hypothetical protein
MKAPRALALAAFALIACTAPSPASIQAQMYCWADDQEFPVPCEEPDEEDDEAAAPPAGAQPAWPRAEQPGPTQ